MCEAEKCSLRILFSQSFSQGFYLPLPLEILRFFTSQVANLCLRHERAWGLGECCVTFEASFPVVAVETVTKIFRLPSYFNWLPVDLQSICFDGLLRALPRQPTPTPNGHHYRRQSHSGLIVSTTNDNSEQISSEALLSLHNKAHIM